MKNKVAIVLLFCILLSIPVYGKGDTNDQGENIVTEKAFVDRSVNSYFSDWAWDVAWQILEYIGVNWYNSNPVRSIAANRIELTTGSKHFNSSSDDIGNMARIDVQANSVTTAVDMDITVKATCNFLAALNHTISVVLTHVASNTDVIYTNLGYNGMSAYAIYTQAMTGNYSARFITDETVAWDCGIVIYDNNVGGGGGGNTNEPQSNDSPDYLINNEEKTKFLIPAPSHKNITREKTLEILDVDTFYKQMYDTVRKDFVYQFSDFSIGDVIIVRDVIDKISYDADRDKTILEFSTGYGNAEWPFDGDITKDFCIGDELTFQFNVIEEYSENGVVLENTDYAKKAMLRNVFGSVYKERVDIYDYLVID